MSKTSEPKPRAHFTTEFTPGKAKGIDYIFSGEVRRLKKTATPPLSLEAPLTLEEGRRRVRAVVSSAPKDNQEVLWPARGLKKVESAPQDNKEKRLFERRTLAPVSDVPPEKKEQLFPKGGKAMVGGRSFSTSGNILSWNTEPMFPIGVRAPKL